MGGSKLGCDSLGVGGQLLYTAGSVGPLRWSVPSSVSRSSSRFWEFLSHRLRARLSDILLSLPRIRVQPSCGLFGVDRIQGVSVTRGTFRSRLDLSVDCAGASVRLSSYIPSSRETPPSLTLLSLADGWGFESLFSSLILYVGSPSWNHYIFIWREASHSGSQSSFLWFCHCRQLLR